MRRSLGRPDLTARDAATRARVDGAFAAMSGGSHVVGGEPDEPHEHAEDALLDQLEQLLTQATKVLGQLRQGQAAVEGRGDGAPMPDEDTGSPSAQGMP